MKKLIFEYDNYRTYLKDFYLSAKTRDKKFSFRYFARKAGFKSQNFLKQVMDGKRNLTPDSIEKFAVALDLNKSETHFFSNLVLFNQAKDSEQKRKFAREILRSRAYKKINPLKESQFNFFAHWYYIPIRSLVSLRDFQEDPKWIAQAVVPNITPAEARVALEELQSLGLLKRDSLNKLIQSETIIATPDEVSSSSLAKTHKDFMKLAGESIDRFNRSERDISSVTLHITAEKAKKIKEMVQDFRKAIVEEATQDSSPDMVYQVNFQFFPLTRSAKERAK